MAQATPFRPLETGNTWIFRSETASSSNPAPQFRAFVRVTSVGDTLIQGLAYRVLECEALSTTSGQPTDTGRIAVYPTPGASLTVTGSACENIYSGPAPYPTTRITNPLDIGGVSYLMNGTAGGAYPVGPGGSHGFGEYQFDHADPIGMVRWAYVNYPGGGGWSSRAWTLSYAVVNGQSYGVNPVAGEDAPRPDSRLLLTAGPVPTSGTVTLRLIGDTEAAVDVFGVDGRRVFSGAMVGGALTIETRDWAPGVYVARATTNGPAVASRFVVLR